MVISRSAGEWFLTDNGLLALGFDRVGMYDGALQVLTGRAFPRVESPEITTKISQHNARVGSSSLSLFPESLGTVGDMTRVISSALKGSGMTTGTKVALAAGGLVLAAGLLYLAASGDAPVVSRREAEAEERARYYERRAQERMLRTQRKQDRRYMRRMAI